MKTKKYSLISLFALVMVVFFALAMTACIKKPTVTPTPDKGEAGVYYTYAKDGEWTVSLAEGKFTLTASGDTKFGSYVYADDKTITLTDTKSNSVISGTLENQKLILDYNGGKYLFNKKIDYVVTFTTSGDSFTQTVTNGKCAEKPADPAKDGYRFIGWYADEAFTAGYDFSSPITANTTVYGRMEKKEIGQKEYDVTFVVDGKTVKTEKTVNGVSYGLYTPTAEGKEFLGWWTSDFASAEMLTAKYNGEKLTADTTLYAVWKDSSKITVSARADKIEWTSAAPNITYNLKVTGPNGYQTSLRPQSTTADFDFSALEAGTYEVTVEYSTYIGKAYYKNKALAKVSGLRVIEPSILVFDSVENVDYYTVSVVCGNPEHSHTNFNNGKSTNFNFANCPMKEDGIKFTVIAHAYGYADSLPATYTCLRSLGKIGGIEVTSDGDYVVWDTVAGATSYVATVSVNGKTYVKDLGGENLLSIADLTGSVEVSVVAKADGYNPSAAVKVTYTRNKLPSPTGIRVAEKRLYWNKVEGATGYVVNFNGTEYEVENGLTNYLLTEAIAATENTAYTVKVKAIAKEAANNSSYSEEVKMQLKVITGLKYTDGVLSWNPVADAYKYSLKINGKATTIDASAANSVALTFTRSGVNEVELAVIDGKNITSSYSKLNITAYGVYFDARGGSECKTVYLAVGDKLTLPETETEGYEFGGWYNLPGGPESNAKEYVDGQPFTTTGDVALYACWTSRKYNVTLNVDGGAELEETIVKVTYNGKYTLPVPSEVGSEREGMKFNGWYSNPNGAGVQYADNEGNSLGVYRDSKDVTLYAYWVDIFAYTLERDLEVSGAQAYTVSKAPGFALVKKEEVVTIPAYYKGVRVQTVNAGAFKNCTNLTHIRIPNTVSVIETGLNGEISSAFEGCTNLVDVTVYEVEGFTGTPRYYSMKGILISNANDSKLSTIEFVPKGLTGSLVIPEGVQIIPEGIFASSKITDVVIPYTVKTIGKDAFKGNSSLINVVFEERPANYLELKKAENKDYDPAKDLGLTIARDAFSNSNYIENVELPAHLYSMDITSIPSTKLVTIVLGGKDGTKSTGGYYTLNNSVCIDGEGTEKKLFYFAKGITGEYVIPEEITTIGSLAFSGATLSSVVIGENVTLIEAYAFSGTSDGKPIDANGEYSKTVNAYNEPPFKGSACRKLGKITFNGKIDSEHLVIKEGAFYGAASHNVPLLSLTLPANLAELGAYAFGDITGLTTVKVDIAIDVADSEKKYSNNAFAAKNGAKAITSVALGAKVPSSFSVSNVFGSPNLASVAVDKDNANFYSDENGVLYDRVNKEDGSYDYSTAIKYYPKGKEGEFTIPSTVTTVEGGVFAGATKLTKITIHEGVSFIGVSAFDGCTSLAEVVFSPSTKKDAEGKLIEVDLEIGDEAFANCKALTEIIIPGRAKKLGESVFKKCNKLVTATFEEGVREMGDGVFDSCSSLTTVYFPATLEKLGTYDSDGNLMSVSNVFSDCEELETIDIAEGNEKMMTREGLFYLVFTTETTDANGNKTEKTEYELVMAPMGKAGAVNIDAKTRKIWAYAFRSNKGITEITFGTDNKMDGTLEIEKLAFSSMKALTTLTLPVGVRTIESWGISGSISDKDNILETIVIPYTVTTIKPNAFASQSALKNIVFQELPTTKTVKNEETGVTEEVALTKEEKEELIKKYPLELASGGTTTGSYNPTDSPSYAPTIYGCFSSLKSLEVVELPERTTKIGAYAFAKSGITKIVIPSTVTTIERGAFLYNVPTVDHSGGHGGGSSTSFKLGVTTGSRLKEVVFSENSKLTAIPENCFSAAAIESIEIPEGIKTIGYMAFYDCVALKSVKLPSTLESFRGNFKNYKIVFKNQVATVTTTDVKPTATSYVGCNFQYCVSLETVEFAEDNKVTTIEYRMFDNSGLVNLEIPANVTTIDNEAFTTTKSLDTVTFKTYTLADILKQTGKTSESELTEEEKAKVGKNDLTVVGKRLFYGLTTAAASSIRSIIFPETTANVLQLGVEMFYNVTTLEEMRIPSQVNSLTKVFDNCKSSVQVELSENNRSLKLDTEYQLILTQTGDTIESAYGIIAKETIDLTKISGLQAIKDNAFKGQTNIKNVVIPSSVTTIGASAFSGCTALENIVIPSSVTTIGASAFGSCTALETVTFETDAKGKSALESLGKSAFSNNKALKAIDLSATKLEILNDSTFSGCSALASVTLKEGLTRIGTGTSSYSGAFQECKALREITIPASVQDLGAGTFTDCKSLVTVTFAKGSQVTTLGSNTFYGCASLKTVVLPEGLTSLGTKTFYGAGLEEFTFPANISTIGASLFSNAKQLAEVKVLGKITSIGANAFEKTAIRSFDFSTVNSIGASAFAGCANLVGTVTEDGNGKETINAIDLSGVTELGNSAFSGCTLLEKVKLTKDDGTGLAVLPDSLFKNCVSMTEITLPSNVEHLGKNTFEGSGLTSIYLPSGITGIMSSATKSKTALDTTSTQTFYNCVNLTKVTTETEGQITNIAKSVFEGCTALSEFDFTNVQYIGASAFKGTAIKGTKKETEEGKPEEYTLDLSKVKKTDDSAFENCNEITEVTFGSGYSNNSASTVFKNCLGLKKVTFDAKTSAAQKIGSSMFEGCASLEEVTLFAKVNEISTKAFYGTALKKVEIPAGVTMIGINAFGNCKSLTEVTFAQATTELYINNYAFDNCVAIKKIALPDRVTKIGDYAFQNCISLETGDGGVFTLPKNLANKSNAYTSTNANMGIGVGRGAFAGCVTIKEFAIDASNKDFKVVDGLVYMTQYGRSTKTALTKLLAVPCSYGKDMTITADDVIAPYSFKYVQGVNTVTFAEGVTEIPDTIFAGFTGLTTVNLPSTVVKIGNGSFNGCTSLRNVNLPEGLETIDGYAFQDCAELKIIDLPSTLTTIGSEAFSGAGLTQVILPANLTSLGTSAFSNCANLETVVLNDLLEALPDSVFQDCVKLPAIDLKNVTSIGKMTFSGCATLANVDLTGVTAIGNNAFENAFTALAAEARPVITIPASIETLGTYLFKGAAVKEVKFDGVPAKDGVPTLPDYMFCNSTIEKVVLPEGLVTLATGTFAGCKNVDITYPASLTTIERYAFKEYVAETFTFPATVTTLDYYVFESAKVDTVTIPDTVTKMGDQVFKLSAIRKVVLGKGITVVGMMTFLDCHELEEVILPDTIKEIEYKSFWNTTKLKKLVIPAGVVFNTGTSSESLFDGWTEDQTIYFRGSEDSYTFGPNWRGTGKMKVVFNYTGE